jgi:hypothetical protein
LRERGDEKTRGFVTVSPKGATLSKRSGERIPLSPQAKKQMKVFRTLFWRLFLLSYLKVYFLR